MVESGYDNVIVGAALAGLSLARHLLLAAAALTPVVAVDQPAPPT